jgi:hypothetical protein
MRSRVGLGMTCLVTMSMGLLLLLPAQLYPRLSFPVGVGDARREEGAAAAARRRDPPKPGEERQKEPRRHHPSTRTDFRRPLRQRRGPGEGARGGGGGIWTRPSCPLGTMRGAGEESPRPKSKAAQNHPTILGSFSSRVQKRSMGFPSSGGGRKIGKDTQCSLCRSPSLLSSYHSSNKSRHDTSSA